MIETERLVLRGWTDADRTPFHAMYNDPEVMAFIGPLSTLADSEAAIDRQRALQDAHGHCFWAIERRADGAFLGFCGLVPGAADLPIAGEIEIGWRLARAHWGQGYAAEAAQASLAWGWRMRDAERIVAITVPENRRSWGLMERLGMHRLDDGDFDHPRAMPALRQHITYAIDRG